MTSNNKVDPNTIPNHSMAKQRICDCVRDAMEAYFEELGDHPTTNLHELVMSQVERPLFESVLRHTNGNMTKASQILGMNRGTLRTRLKKYGLD